MARTSWEFVARLSEQKSDCRRVSLGDADTYSVLNSLVFNASPLLFEERDTENDLVVSSRYALVLIVLLFANLAQEKSIRVSHARTRAYAYS